MSTLPSPRERAARVLSSSAHSAARARRSDVVVAEEHRHLYAAPPSPRSLAPARRRCVVQGTYPARVISQVATGRECPGREDAGAALAVRPEEPGVSGVVCVDAAIERVALHAVDPGLGPRM